MELLGLGSVLDLIVRRGTRKTTGDKTALQAGDKESKSDGFACVPQALVQEWRGRSLKDKLMECAPRRTPPANALEQIEVAPPAPPRPTPSEILTSSSIRMMLSMASAFRRSNPAVLEATCGTLLEVLLEVPSLALAPLRSEASSIEATTFRKVTDFCTELLGSPSPVERGTALGLYLALAISRGEVSGLLETVTCLLDRQSSLAARQDRSAGDEESVSEGFGAEQQVRISSVLQKLADHHVDLHLSFPDECEGTRLAIRLPSRGAHSRLGEGGSDPIPERGRAGGDNGIDFDCPATAATDGKFVYAWHPDVGLLKAGTGLRGTVKGRVYVENTEAGICGVDVCQQTKGMHREGFLALVGDRIYLQAEACMNPERFLVVRTSDLAVEGSTEVPALALLSSIVPAEQNGHSSTSLCIPSRGMCETAVKLVEREDERVDRLLGGVQKKAAGRRHPPRGGGGEIDAYGVPLCCDGRLLYALVPLESTRRPSVIAVDLVNSPTRAVFTHVELQRPDMALTRGDADSGIAAYPSGSNHAPCGDASGHNFQLPGANSEPAEHGGHAPADPSSAEEWPWWRDGSAMPGVRMYCNGDRLVVCWLDDAYTVEESNAKSSWWGRVAQAEVRCGVVPSPQDSVGSVEVDFRRITHMARFRLSTGECEDVENNAFLSGTWRPFPPSVAYDSASNLILRCSLRSRLPASPRSTVFWCSSSSSEEPQFAAELCVSLWRNCGLAPGGPADGPYEWKQALATLAQAGPTESSDRMTPNVKPAKKAGSQGDQASGGSCAGIPALTRASLYVLAHLDRLGAHFLGWGGNMVQPDEAWIVNAGKGLSVPFCYELVPATFRNLISLVENFSISPKGRGGDGVPDHMRVYVICASLRLMKVNVGMLLSRRSTARRFGDEALWRSFLGCLLGLVEGYDGSDSTPTDNGQAVIAREALRVMVGSIDLLYPTKRCQASLLSAYLRAFDVDGDRPFTPAARTLTIEMLARASTNAFLQNLEVADGDSGSSSSTAELSEAQRTVIGPNLKAVESNHVLSLAPDACSSLAKTLLDVSTRQAVGDVRRAAAVGTREMETAGSQEECFEDQRPIEGGGRGSAEIMGQAVLKALGAVLNFKASSEFLRSRRDRKASGEVSSSGDSEGVPLTFGSLLGLFLSVLRAAQTVLGSIDTAACLLPRVLDRLRSGLVGSLLPLCLTSALVLMDNITPEVFVLSSAGGMKQTVSSLLDTLVQVSREVGRLRTATAACGNMTQASGFKADESKSSSTGMERGNQERYWGKRWAPVTESISKVGLVAASRSAW